MRALKKEHQTTLKEAVFEERRKQQEATGAMQEALEQAKQTAAQAQVEVSDLKVQVN